MSIATPKKLRKFNVGATSADTLWSVVQAIRGGGGSWGIYSRFSAFFRRMFLEKRSLGSNLCNMQLPRFCDLEILADRLKGRAGFKRVASDIKKLAHIQSCSADVAQAITNIKALDVLLENPSDYTTLESNSLQTSLLFSSVVLYARATVNAGQKGERGSISIVHHFDMNQRKIHSYLSKLRNRAIAHVYHHEDIEGNAWHKQAIFMIETPMGWKTASAVVRVQIHVKALAALKLLLPLAKSIFDNKFQELNLKVTSVFNAGELSIADVLNSPFDAVGFFGSEREVLNVIGAMNQGSAAGVFEGPS